MSHETNFGTYDTNRELIVDALRYPSTKWELWNRTKCTATVVENITIGAASLQRAQPSGQREPVVITAQRRSVIDPSRIAVSKWAYDGEVMVRLPEQDPQTGEYLRASG